MEKTEVLLDNGQKGHHGQDEIRLEVFYILIIHNVYIHIEHLWYLIYDIIFDIILM